MLCAICRRNLAGRCNDRFLRQLFEPRWYLLIVELKELYERLCKVCVLDTHVSYCCAFIADAASAADAVCVDIDGLWHVELENIPCVVKGKPSRGNVCCNHDTKIRLLKARDPFLSLPLLHLPVEVVRIEATAPQHCCDLLCLDPAVGEDNDAAGRHTATQGLRRLGPLGVVP